MSYQSEQSIILKSGEKPLLVSSFSNHISPLRVQVGSNEATERCVWRIDAYLFAVERSCRSLSRKRQSCLGNGGETKGEGDQRELVQHFANLKLRLPSFNLGVSCKKPERDGD